MKNLAIAFLAATALTSFGCKKEGGGEAMTGGAPAGQAAKPVAAAPSAAAGNCVEGAYKDPTGSYCVKVPAGYQPPKSTRKDDIKSVDQFETDDGLNFTITVWHDKAAKFDDMKRNMATDGGGSKMVESGDFEGGNGFYVHSHNDAQKETGTESVVKSADKLISCESLTGDDKPLNPADACKTLRAM